MNARPLPFYFVIVMTMTTAWLSGISRANADDANARRAALETQSTSSDARRAALALYELAELDDHDYRFASALARYDASIARDPSHRFALRARTHGDTLRSHSEGDFAPYSELEHIRRDPVASRDPVALLKLAADADAFPPGLVRVEARMLVGDALVSQGDTARGLPLLDLVDRDPKADTILHHQAAHELVDSYLLQNDPDAAMQVATRRNEDPTLAKTVTHWIRRRQLRKVSIAVLALFALASTIAIARGAANGKSGAVGRSLKRFAPLALAFAAWIGLFGGVLAASFEKGNESPFLVLAAGAVPVFFIARAWGASGGDSRAERIARAALAAASIAAIAFVVLSSVGNGVYLAGFGL
jgi:hypothetical protein